MNEAANGDRGARGCWAGLWGGDGGELGRNLNELARGDGEAREANGAAAMSVGANPPS